MGIKQTCLTMLFIAFVFWTQRPYKFDYTKKSIHDDEANQKVMTCPSFTTEAHLLFGGTSLLGRYITDTWKTEFKHVCLINFSRKPCPRCDINFSGDLRDTSYIEEIFKYFSAKKQKISTVILSTRPELTSTSWRTFMEVNYFALVEVTNLAQRYNVKQLLYVSSIAATSHYLQHHLTKESDLSANPILTDYEAPYDLSKRIAEDYILSKNSAEFRTIALRVCGILGGEGDPFFHHRSFPFQMTFNSPVIVDYGFAGNIADALAEIYRVISVPTVQTDILGKFYFYTGEHIFENSTAAVLSQLTNKPLLQIPHFLLNPFLIFWQYFRWDHDSYTLIDLVRMAEIEQTFDQTLFYKTFPNFKPKYTIIEALKRIYGPGSPKGEGKEEL